MGLKPPQREVRAKSRRSAAAPRRASTCDASLRKTRVLALTTSARAPSGAAPPPDTPDSTPFAHTRRPRHVRFPRVGLRAARCSCAQQCGQCRRGSARPGSAAQPAPAPRRESPGALGTHTHTALPCHKGSFSRGVRGGGFGGGQPRACSGAAPRGGAPTRADALTRARTLARVPAAYAAAAAALAAAAAGERSGAWHIQPVVEAGGGCAGRGLSGDRLGVQLSDSYSGTILTR